MSRPNTGSVTALAVSGLYGHAVDPQQDRLPGRRDRAADGQRGEDADDDEDDRGDRASGPGMSSASKVDPARLVLARPRGHGSGRRPAGLLGRLVQPVEQVAERPAAHASGSRQQPAGQPQVAEEDDQGDDGRAEEQAELGAEPGPEHAVEADALVPQRVGPQVEADAEQQEHGQDERRR